MSNGSAVTLAEPGFTSHLPPKSKISVVFVMEQPMNVYAPLMKALEESGVRVAAICFGSGADAVGDLECGGTSFWSGSELFAGGELKFVQNSFLNGVRQAWIERNDATLTFVQGSFFPFCRGYVLGSALFQRCNVGIRTDNVLDTEEGGSWIRGVKMFLLPAWYRLAGFVAPASSGAEVYVGRYGMKGVRHLRLPYVIPFRSFHCDENERAVDRSRVRSRLGVSDEAFVVLIVAKLNERETPWDAARLPLRLKRRIIYVVVGDGEKREEFESQLQMGCREAKFLGYQEYRDLPALYHAADVFLHAPRREVWGVSVNEALAAGCPVVAADTVGSARDMVSEDVGRIYPFGDIEALAKAMELVRSMYDGRSDIRGRCAAAAERFSPVTVALRLTELARSSHEYWEEKSKCI